MPDTFERDFYKTGSGRSPVEDYLATLGDEELGRFLARSDTLAANFPHVNQNLAKKLRGEIYELRIYGLKKSRVLFCTFNDPRNVIVYLLGISKKQNKVPPEDIVQAEENRDEWLKQNPDFDPIARNKALKEATKEQQRQAQKSQPKKAGKRK